MPFLTNNSQAQKSNVDKIFAEGDVYVILETPKMQYKKFTATNVLAQGVMKESAVELQKVFFNHARGSVELRGTLKNGLQLNPVSIHTQMRNLDIPILFESFNNFGQDAITDKNLKGRISADIDYSTALTNKAELVTARSQGVIDFNIQEGELNHFEPLEQIAQKAFRKQDFSEIRFADLKNKLQVSGTAFIINPMEIRSTAITLFVQGVYDIKNGTDMSIVLPLRNLTKNQSNTDLSDEVKTRKGISLRLRAKTDENRKLKLTWDPFGKSIRSKEVIRESADNKRKMTNRTRLEKDTADVKN
jgi:hypothetical protein